VLLSVDLVLLVQRVPVSIEMMNHPATVPDEMSPQIVQSAIGLVVKQHYVQAMAPVLIQILLSLTLAQCVRERKDARCS